MANPTAASTPAANTDVPIQEFAPSFKARRLCLQPRKRKNRDCAEPGIITNLANLPSNMKDFISPFYHNDAQANKKWTFIYHILGKCLRNSLIVMDRNVISSRISQKPWCVLITMLFILENIKTNKH